jgi:hypothetical protein
MGKQTAAPQRHPSLEAPRNESPGFAVDSSAVLDTGTGKEGILTCFYRRIIHAILLCTSSLMPVSPVLQAPSH